MFPGISIIFCTQFVIGDDDIRMDQRRQIKAFGRCIDKNDIICIFASGYNRCRDLFVFAKNKILMDLICNYQYIVLYTNTKQMIQFLFCP